MVTTNIILSDWHQPPKIEHILPNPSPFNRGMYYPLRAVATKALNGPIDVVDVRNQIFQERRDVVVKGLREVGLKGESPKATFYIWSAIPKGFTSQGFCFKVLDAANVWMIPGPRYGKHGEGCLRISLTHRGDRLADAMGRLKRFMTKVK